MRCCLEGLGFSHAEIRAVMGGNALRVIAAGVVPMPQAG